MKIIVTRPAADAAPFAALLGAAGAEPVLSPVMEIVRASAPAPAGYDALAFTSANGVRAFAEASSDRAVTVFAVGEATGAQARALGFVDVRIAEGDVEALALLIASAAPRRTLHVAGADRAGDLVALLAARGLAAERVTLYEARPLPFMTDAAREAFLAGAGVAFFSPRSVALFNAQAAAAGIAAPYSAVAWCLSEAVAAQAEDFADRRVAPAPTAQSLAALIGDHLRESRVRAAAVPPPHSPSAAVRPAPDENAAGHTPAAEPGGAKAEGKSAGRPTRIRALVPAAAAAVGAALLALAFVWSAGRRAPPATSVADPTETRLAMPEMEPSAVADESMGKVLNSVSREGKTGIETIDPESFPQARVDSLPAPPSAHMSNAGLQEAAKAAADLFNGSMAGGDFVISPNERAAGRAGDRAPLAGGEQEAERLAAELAKARRSEARAAITARRSLALAALQAKIFAGEPFEAELAEWREAGGASAAQSLDEHATAGISTVDRLQADFAPARRAALAAGRRAEAGGFVDRIGAAFANLWGVRPAQPISGMSTVAVISRAEAAVEAGDIARALAEIESLRPPAAGPFAQWKVQARARIDSEIFLSTQARALSSAASIEDPLQ